MRGRTCAGTYVSGTGLDGRPRAVFLYHVVDNADSMARDGCQAVAWQTAINPVVALELLATGAWSGAGVLGPEAFDAVPFLDLLDDLRQPARQLEERDPPARRSWEAGHGCRPLPLHWSCSATRPRGGVPAAWVRGTAGPRNRGEGVPVVPLAWLEHSHDDGPGVDALCPGYERPANPP